MDGVILRGRLTPFRGALTFPNTTRLELMCRMDRLLQPAAWAICDDVGELFSII